jgi:hypothetical protein
VKNLNPVVGSGRCRKCGQPVTLFEKDAADYLENPQRGLAHFRCPDAIGEHR